MFEITDFGSSEKSNKNKLAALMKKNDLGFGSRKIFYSLVIFECRYWTMIEATLSLCPRRPEVQTADVIRVDVQCEAAPTQPEATASLTSSQVLRCTVLYCAVLYCAVLYCTALYCTVLYLCGKLDAPAVD